MEFINRLMPECMPEILENSENHIKSELTTRVAACSLNRGDL